MAARVATTACARSLRHWAPGTFNASGSASVARPGRKDPATFVLENFTAAERPEVGLVCEQAADATELLIELGLETAQNTVHAW